MCVLVQLHIGDLFLVQTVGGHQLDVGLAGGIQCLAQPLGAAGKVTRVDAGALDAAVGVVGVFLNEIIVQLDQVGAGRFP